MLDQQTHFIIELDRLKAVKRQTLVLSDHNRQENSAEHSWHITTMALILKDYVVEEIDINRVVMMLLIHDIVEIDAGDTFAFSSQSELDSQHEKELVAAHRLFGLLPSDQCQMLKALWLEFEEATSSDARFAKAMDRLQPLLQNLANEGGSWAKHHVSREQVIQRNQYLKTIAPELWQYACEQIDIAVQKGWLKA